MSADILLLKFNAECGKGELTITQKDLEWGKNIT